MGYIDTIDLYSLPPSLLICFDAMKICPNKLHSMYFFLHISTTFNKGFQGSTIVKYQFSKVLQGISSRCVKLKGLWPPWISSPQSLKLLQCTGFRWNTLTSQCNESSCIWEVFVIASNINNPISLAGLQHHFVSLYLTKTNISQYKALSFKSNCIILHIKQRDATSC